MGGPQVDRSSVLGRQSLEPRPSILSPTIFAVLGSLIVVPYPLSWWNYGSCPVIKVKFQSTYFIKAPTLEHLDSTVADAYPIRHAFRISFFDSPVQQSRPDTSTLVGWLNVDPNDVVTSSTRQPEVRHVMVHRRICSAPESCYVLCSHVWNQKWRYDRADWSCRVIRVWSVRLDRESDHSSILLARNNDFVLSEHLFERPFYTFRVISAHVFKFGSVAGC